MLRRLRPHAWRAAWPLERWAAIVRRLRTSCWCWHLELDLNKRARACVCARGRQRLWYTGQREKRGSLTYTHLSSGIEYHRGEMIINLVLLTQQKRIYINTCPWSVSSGAPPCFYGSPARTSQEKHFGIVKLSQKTPQLTLLNLTCVWFPLPILLCFSLFLPLYIPHIQPIPKQLCSNPAT